MAEFCIYQISGTMLGNLVIMKYLDNFPMGVLGIACWSALFAIHSKQKYKDKI